ncbi:MAG: hypothetical protein ACYDIA_13730 [Candidatus Humimicrobiaceae bacterium]
MFTRPEIRDLTKEPEWRDNLRKEIEYILYDKKEKDKEDLFIVIDGLYKLFINEFSDFTKDHTEFRNAILELQNPGLPPIKR